MFEEERKKATFDNNLMSQLLYGSRKSFQEFQKMQAFAANDPVIRFNPSMLHQSRADMMTDLAKKILKFHEAYPLDGSNELFKTNLFAISTPFSLHGLMFLPTLRNLCDPEQEKLFLEPAIRGQIIGCYAQTELAHGSDVQNLLTTATYDSSSQSFIINTPQIGATKWWIGDLGLYCNHAAVFAQLIINGKKYGVHAFLVPIRDPKTLLPLKGIQVGDIGPKHGFQTKDNGYAIFNHVRIPRRNMLMKYHFVSKQGEYSLKGDEKISYATMLITRSNITQILANSLSKVCTITTRYSLARTQFKNSKGVEVPVFNYQTQQEKIIPKIAEAYASWFAAKSVTELGYEVFESAKKGNFDRLNEAHIISSGVKAILSQDVLKSTQIMRRACGGHGFSAYSGIVTHLLETTPLYTLEGEFTVLLLQVGRFLIKSFTNLMKGKALPPSVDYIKQLTTGNLNVDIQTGDSLSCPYFIGSILTAHSCGKLKSTMQKFQYLLNEKKLTIKEIQDYKAGISINDAAVAHCYVLVYNYFLNAMRKATDPKVKAILSKMIVLYGIDKILERSAKFYQTNTLKPEAFSLLFAKKQALMDELRPESLSLVEAFGYDDNILLSAIGAKDGKPYQTLLDWAKNKNTLNTKAERDQIVEVIKKTKSQLRPRL